MADEERFTDMYHLLEALEAVIGCAGRRTTASWSSTTSWKTPRMLDGPFAS